MNEQELVLWIVLVVGGTLCMTVDDDDVEDVKNR